MSNLVRERVHVAPIGFEFDRVVLPIKGGKADRVWLLVGYGDKATGFKNAILEDLKKQGIEVQEMMHTRTDLFDIIRATRDIIQKERGNIIYANLSSGSKIQAVGCVMACMMFGKGDVTPYYAEPKEYNRLDTTEALSTGLKQTVTIPRYTIPLPPSKFVKMVHVVNKHGRIAKKQLLEELVRDEIVDKNTNLSVMDRTLFRPYADWGFLETEKIGRRYWVSLTPEGKNAITFLSGTI